MRWSFLAMSTLKAEQWHERFFERRYILGGVDFVEANDDCRVFASTVLFKTKKRSLDNIAQIRKIVLDLDIYASKKNQGRNPAEVFREIQANYFLTGRIPTPNIVTFSGKGIYLEWLLEFTPGWAVKKRDAILNVLSNILEEYSPDAKSKDATHVFGVPGSINWKHGRDSVVQSFKNDLPEYTLVELERSLPKIWEVLPSVKPIAPPKKTKPVPRPKIRTAPATRVPRIGLGRNINDAQMDFVIDLINLRKGYMYRCREMALFVFRNAYHKNESARFYAKDQTLFEESLAEARKLNALFYEPLDDYEVRKWSLTDHTLYHIITSDLVKWFDLTMDEQVQLRLKTREAKREKEKRRSKKNREIQGATSNDRLRQKIVEVIARNPKMKDYKVAEIVRGELGKCSEKTVKKVREGT
jgi:hypothetical protein